MTHIVTEKCIKCKFTDCVEVCPVDCFYEDDEMLFIHPDECIDCGVCVEECPVEAIVANDQCYDSLSVDEIIEHKNINELNIKQKEIKKLANLNKVMSQKLVDKKITAKIDPLPKAEQFKDKEDKIKYVEQQYPNIFNNSEE